MAVSLPRNKGGGGVISSQMISNAIAGLRFDVIKSVKWDVRPSVGIVAKDIERLSLDIRSFREPLTRVIKLVMIPSIRKNFDLGGRPPWEGLSESTIRARNFSAWPILQVTGLLRKRATQFNIWDITPVSATVRSLPDDVYYGLFHQAGAEGHQAGSLSRALTAHAPGSKGANALIQKFVPKAIKDLESRGILKPGQALNADLKKFIKNRAIGLLLEEDEREWHLPARPFIMWQEEDIPKMDAIFIAWMTERAIRVGKFSPEM